MERVDLIGEKLVTLENQSDMTLQYYMVEESTLEGKASGESEYMYGIRVDKQYEGIVESEEVRALTYSKSLAHEFVRTLMLHTVTPITLVETVDDLMTIKLFS